MTRQDIGQSHDSAQGRPKLLAQGLDSLYVTYDFDLEVSDIDFSDLEFRKMLARDGDREQATFELGSERLTIKPGGAFPYAYVLSNDAFTLSLARRMSPGAMVQFSSKALWHDGADQLHSRILAWAESVTARQVKPEGISRADFAFDFDMAGPDFNIDDFLTRLSKDNCHRQHGTLQTVILGKGAVVVRIYDKIAEIHEKSGKTWFYDIWGQRENVWRVEFQVRTERLRKAGIHTYEDLKELQADLLRELAASHTTLRSPTGDSSKARWPLHPLWTSLQAAIASMPQTGLVRDFKERSFIDYRMTQLARSTYGHLKGLAALYHLSGDRRGELPELKTLLDEFPDLVEGFHSERLWHDDIAQRLNDYGQGRW